MFGGPPPVTDESAANRLLELHREKSAVKRKLYRDEYIASVNVEVEAENTKQNTALTTFATSEGTPVAGRDTLQALITAGNNAAAAPPPLNADAINRGTAAQAVATAQGAVQTTRQNNMQIIQSRLANKLIAIANPPGGRSSITTEITEVLNTKQRYLANLQASKQAAERGVTALYTDAYKRNLKDAYGITDAEVNTIQTNHLNKVKAEYNQRIADGKAYMDKLIGDYMKAADGLDANFSIRRAFEKFIQPDREPTTYLSVGGDNLDQMKRELDSKYVFKTTTSTLGITHKAYFWKTPDGKLVIDTKNVNKDSIKDMVLMHKAMGKKEVTINFHCDDEKWNQKDSTKSDRNKKKREMAIEYAKEGIKVTNYNYTLEDMRIIEDYKQQQIQVKTAIHDKEVTKTTATRETFTLVNHLTDVIRREHGEVERLTGEFRNFVNNVPPAANAAAQQARLEAKYNEICDARLKLMEASDDQLTALAALRADIGDKFNNLNPAQKDIILQAQSSALTAVRNGVDLQAGFNTPPVGVASVSSLVDTLATNNPGTYWSDNAKPFTDDFSNRYVADQERRVDEERTSQSNLQLHQLQARL